MIALTRVALSAFRLLRSVPWWAWLIMLVSAAWWWDRGSQYEAGVASENARWTQLQAEAARETQRAQARRDRDAADIKSRSDERATDAVVETRTETAAAVERVRHETRIIEIPAGCPVALPDRVRDDGAAAVARARAAGRSLRAASNP